MRYILGLVLVLICLPSGGATDRTMYLAGLAGVPIHLFDLRSAEVSSSFRSFLAEVPMTNDRPLPAALVDDTAASLSFLKAFTPSDQPSYFVATYIQKTPFVSVPEAERTRYLRRYGEDVYPQQVCPVFISRGDADVARLLSSAVGLPPSYFRKVEGSVEAFDRLFAFTEASHCGFIARELVQPTVIPRDLSERKLRVVLEALGDYEATVVFRSLSPNRSAADEADALFAARLLSMFLLPRENAYTAVPGLVHEYERLGVEAAHDELDRVVEAVRLARRTVRTVLGPFGSAAFPVTLSELARRYAAAKAAGRLDTGDRLADALIEALPRSIRLIEGEPVPRGYWLADDGSGALRRPPARLVTLSGAGVL